jgi:hypothetical protein
MSAPTSDERCVAIVTACAGRDDNEVRRQAAEFRPEDVATLASLAAAALAVVAEAQDVTVAEKLAALGLLVAMFPVDGS